MLDARQARQLLDSIDTSHVVGLRDRALIGVMVYSFARVSATVGLKVDDYYPNGKRWWLRLHEKGGKFQEVPAHHLAEEYLDAYLEAAGIRDQKKSALFRSVPGRRRQLTDHAIERIEVWEMIRRRTRDAGLSPTLCCHTFRATGITAYLSNGGIIEGTSSGSSTSAGESAGVLTWLSNHNRSRLSHPAEQLPSWRAHGLLLRKSSRVGETSWWL